MNSGPQDSTDESEVNHRAVIIGAGPAGLTAALELLDRTGFVPIVLEQSGYMGGISRTVNYKGNRIDIGGHRFFSKSDRVLEWWQKILPVEAGDQDRQSIAYHNQTRDIARTPAGPAARDTDNVMLVRERRSRIFYLRRFFDYPIRLSSDTLRKLGAVKTIRIALSYLRSAIQPIRPERTLEEFFINRFGRELYRTFFKSYTEKVWGVSCDKISAEWGAQRIKGLSVYKTLSHAVKKALSAGSGGIRQRDTETSLIDRFLYPKFGPGQMWEEVAKRVVERGGAILTGWKVERIEHDPKGRIIAVHARSQESGQTRVFRGRYYFSTMPVKELIRAMRPSPPPAVQEIANGLQYRDFIAVGLLCRKLQINEVTASGKMAVRDNWIYIQDSSVLVGRLQIFNNWSPYMVADPATTWIGLEYFCNQGDDLWTRSDEEMRTLARDEMHRVGIVNPEDILDGTVIRMEKTYPAYFGAYERFPQVIEWINRYQDLFLIGRNGMHKYNNQDHSMLTAMISVDNIIAGVTDRTALWALNTEQDYHEESSKASAAAVP
jgi:protoporphyrinogen oxidase